MTHLASDRIDGALSKGVTERLGIAQGRIVKLEGKLLDADLGGTAPSTGSIPTSWPGADEDAGGGSASGEKGKQGFDGEVGQSQCGNLNIEIICGISHG